MINKEKKRVLFIIPSLRGGGAEKVLVDILNNFDFCRYEVSLLLLRNEGVHINRLSDSVKVLMGWSHRIPNKWYVNRYTIGYFRRKQLKKITPNVKYDVIISFMEGDALSYHSSILKFSKKNISWVHCDLNAFHWSKAFFQSNKRELQAYKRMDSTVFVSLKSRSSFFKLFGCECNPVVIRNLIDTAAIQRAGEDGCPIKKHNFTVINVGRLCQQKRQDRLIEAIALLKSKYRCEIDLWLLGVGDLKDSYVKLASELGVTSNVKFLGFQDNPYKYIKEADVFVLSSETEGYPLVLCEALCLSKPVVSTKVTGASEILEGDAGILVEETPQALAEAINSLVTSPSKLSLYSERAKSRSEIFVPERTMAEIYRLFE